MRVLTLAFCFITAALLATYPAATAAAEVSGTAGMPVAAASSDPSMFTQLIAWIFEQQRLLHRELTQDLRDLTNGNDVQAGLGLILASFLYGIFHAAGPGHGKAILTTYLLTHRERVSRGVRLAALGATCQGTTAIVLVYGLIWLAGWVPRDASAAAIWSERASYGLVVFVGVLLTIRAIKNLYSRFRERISIQAGLRRLQGALPPTRNAGPSHHDHSGDQHAHDCSCGHVHAPSVEQLEVATDFRTTLGLILSIGLRPCSGAVLILVFASVMGIAWAGIAAVVAMSVGTALAVAGLALLAVGARQWAASLAGAQHDRYRSAGDIVALAGGTLVVAIGLSLITASFAPSHPLGLM